MPPPPRSRPFRSRFPSWLLWAGTVAAAVAVGLIFYGLRYVYRTEPKIFEGLAPQPSANAAYDLSPQQQSTYSDLGWPEAFTILFYSEEQEDGSLAPVRYEVWTYHSLGRELAFLEGELAEEWAIEPPAGEVLPIPYHPDQFGAGMRLQEVIDAAGLDSVLYAPVEPELVAGGELFYAAELTFGTKHGRLAYVQALALEEEG